MPIAINGSGTITGISVGGIPDGTVDTDVLAANAVTFAKIGTTEQGQLCKAWVNFNGTGVVAIRASYNVSSITDNGTGDYTVNFTTALADANYNALISVQSSPADGPDSPCVFYDRTTNVKQPPTASSYRVSTTASNGIARDRDYVCTSVFR